ncbi:hypothetical protein ACQ4PT_061479 [Festuca glaucescens]
MAPVATSDPCKCWNSKVKFMRQNGRCMVTLKISCSSDGTTQSLDSDERDRTPGKAPAVESSSDEFSEYTPSESDSIELDDAPMLSRDIVLSRRCHHTEEQMEEINALVAKIRPEIPVLVIVMKKNNVTPKEWQLDEEDEAGVDAPVAEIQPEIPLLVVQIMKSNVNGSHSSLVISRGYGRTHFPKESQTITLRMPGRKKWHAIFNIRNNGGYVFDRVWLKFVRDNHLHEKDICLFQPFDKGEGKRFTVMVHLLLKARSTSRSMCGDVICSNNGGSSTKAMRNIPR